MVTTETIQTASGNIYAPLWSAEQIAEWGGLHVGTVRNWASSGRLPMPRRLGRTVRWNADDILAWFAQDAELTKAN